MHASELIEVQTRNYDAHKERERLSKERCGIHQSVSASEESK